MYENLLKLDAFENKWMPAQIQILMHVYNYHNIGRSQVKFVANLYLNRSTKGTYYNAF